MEKKRKLRLKKKATLLFFRIQILLKSNRLKIKQTQTDSSSSETARVRTPVRFNENCRHVATKPQRKWILGSGAMTSSDVTMGLNRLAPLVVAAL